MANKIDFQVNMKTNESDLKVLQNTFKDLQKIKPINFDGAKADLEQMQKAAAAVGKALQNSYNNNLGSINFSTFNSELQKSKTNLNEVRAALTKFGPEGQMAFADLSSQLTTTNLKLKQSHGLIQSMGQTMINTVKWGIASSIMNSFTASVKNSFSYVKSLEASLTDIRIVTGDSQEKMDQFAESANKAAQSLGRSTMDYTKSALTFYQQGLSDQDVQARTEATLKAQNITGFGTEMADYLTSVWNGYKATSEQVESYIDKMAAVADSSASNMGELATAMSKVAATANAMGVDIDQLNAQIATVVQTTRQAPQSVGTAFKTIYSRLNDIKTGSDDAQISLGNYSGKMAELGINVLDTNGKLRDTGQVIEQIGSRWGDMSRQQRVYLAQTMGGQRQITQVMALFDNWNVYTNLLNTSLESQGVLTEKNSRYMESLGAKMQQLGAAQEKVKQALIDEDDMSGMIEGMTSFVDLFGSLIQSIGGGTNMLAGFGGVLLKIFSGVISKQITNIVNNSKIAAENQAQLQASIDKTRSQGALLGLDDEVIAKQESRRKTLLQLSSSLTAEEAKHYDKLIAQLGPLEQIEKDFSGSVKQAQKYKQAILAMSDDKTTAGLNEGLTQVIDKTTLLGVSLQEIGEKKELLTFKNIQADTPNLFTEMTNSVAEMSTVISSQGVPALNRYEIALQEINNAGGYINATEEQLRELYQAGREVFSQTYAGDALITALEEIGYSAQEAKVKAQELRDNLREVTFQKQVQGATQAVAGLGQIGFAINNIVHLTRIWNNENMSTGQKVLQTFTNLTMMIPMLVSGIGSIVTVTTTKTVAELQAAGATVIHTGAQTGLNIALTAGAAAALEFAAALLANPVTWVVAGIVALTVALYKAANAQSQQAKEADKAAQIASKTKQAYDELKKSYDELKNSLEDYNNSQNAIEEMTRGTKEWRDAIIQANGAVLELMSNYPELAQYVSSVNGQLKISEEGQAAVLQAQNKALINAEGAKIVTAQNANTAQARVTAQNISDNAGTFYGNAKDTYGTLLYGNIPIDDVIAVAQALTNSIKDFDQGDLKNNTDKLAEIISQQTGVSQEQVAALLQDTEKLQALGVQLKNNEQTAKMQYKGMVNNALLNSDKYQNLGEEDKAIIEDALAGQLQSDIKAKADQLTRSYTDDLTRFTQADNAIVKDMLSELNKARGTNWRMDANEVRHGDDERTFAFRDQEGKFHELAAEQVADIIATNQALEELQGSITGLQEIINKIQTETGSKEQADALKQFLAGQDLSKASNKTLGDLSGIKLSDLIPEDTLKAIAEQRGQDTEQLQKDWQLAIADQLNKNAALLDNASEVVKEAANHIGKTDERGHSESYRESSGETQNKIISDLENAYKLGGQKGLDAIQGVFSKTENLDAFKQVSDTFDFSTGTAEKFKQALSDAGVETSATNQQLQNYIGLQRAAAAATAAVTPQENYKNVHDITDKLKKGDSVSEQDYKTLQNAGVDVQEFFDKAADGSYKLKLSADQLKKSIESITLQPFRDELDWVEKNIEAINNLKDSKGSITDNSIDDMSQSAVTVDRRDVTDNPDAYRYDEEKLSQQIDLLRQVGVQSQLLSQVQDDINDKKQVEIDKINEISKLMKDHHDELKALGQTEEENKQRQQQLLEMMVNAQAPEFDDDVNEESWERLSDIIEKTAGSGAFKNLSEDLKENRKDAEDLAESMLRYSAAVDKVNKKYKDWEKNLKSGSLSDQLQTMEELDDAYSDLLDLPFEDTLSKDFLKSADNLQLFKQAANGSEQAYNQLLQKAGQDIAAQVGLDTSDFETHKNQIYDQIENLTHTPFEDIKIGADLDNQAVLDKMTEIVNNAGMTADQATNYLASMGVDAQVITTNVPEEETHQATQMQANPDTAEVNWSIPKFRAASSGQVGAGDKKETVYTMESAGYDRGDAQVPTTSYTPRTVTGTAKKDNKATSLRVVSAKKSSGGGFKYQNAGNKGGSKGSGGSGKKGGGNNKKNKKGKTTKAKKLTASSKTEKDKTDRYHVVNTKLSKMAQDLTKINKEREKLTGKDRIKNLEKEIDIIKQQNKLEADKLKIMKDEKKELEQALNSKGYKITYLDGAINNYNALRESAWKKYEAVYNKEKKLTDKYNKMSGKKQQGKKGKKLKKQIDTAKKNTEAAQKAYENTLEQLDRLDELNSAEILEQQQALLENIDAQIELKIEKFNAQIEVDLEMTKANKEWNQFRKNIIDQLRDDDILGQATARFNDIYNYYGTKTNQNLINDLVQKVNNIRQGLVGERINGELVYSFDKSLVNNFDKLDQSTKDLLNEYGTNTALALEDLQKYTEQLMDALEDVSQAVQDVKASYNDMIDKTENAFESQIEQYDFISDLIEHDKNLIELIYGDEAYEKMDSFYKKQQQNNKQELQFERMQKDFWEKQIEVTKQRMQMFDKDSIQYKQAQDRLKQLEQRWMNALNNFNEKLENSISNLTDQYINTIYLIFENLNKVLTDGRGLQYIQDEWQLISDNADDYLDKVNGMYEIEKLRDKYLQNIDDNKDNIRAQQSLNNLMQAQILMLKEKERLTQYDIDRANALLQLELRRLALQNARDSKTKLRLRRDSQGNYTYQYVADQSSILEAKQAVKDAQNEVYNLDKENYLNNLDEIQSTYGDFEEKLQDVYSNNLLSTEDKLNQQALLRQQYAQKINGLLAQNITLRKNLQESAVDSLSDLYNINVNDFKNMTEQQKNILLTQLIPQWDSGVQHMTNKFIEEGGFLSTLKDTFDILKQTSSEYSNELNDLENISNINFDSVTDGQDKNIAYTQEFIDNNKELTQTYIDQFNSIQGVIDQVEKLANTYKTLKDNANEAVEASYKLQYQTEDASSYITTDDVAKRELENISIPNTQVNLSANRNLNSDFNQVASPMNYDIIMETIGSKYRQNMFNLINSINDFNILDMLKNIASSNKQDLQNELNITIQGDVNVTANNPEEFGNSLLGLDNDAQQYINRK